MPQLQLNGTGDCADLCAHALIEAKRATPGGLRREDIALVVRPIIAAHVAEEVAAASPKAKKEREANAKVIPPEPEWVTAYSLEIGWPMDGIKWCDTYAAKGWIVSGKAKMKDWKAAVRNWQSNGWGAESKIYLGPPKQKPVDLRYAPEPSGDWRATAKRVFRLAELPVTWSTWSDVPADHRLKIATAHAT